MGLRAGIDDSHRPWPAPRRPWAMAMRWHRLLFMHWRFEPAVVQGLLPAGLDVDTFDGSAWIGVVPFTMTGVRARWTPALPRLGAFHEINVRTYVREAGRGGGVESRPGVYFFSLDAAEVVAVRVARAVYGLRYFHARMGMDVGADGWTRYESRRVTRSGAGDMPSPGHAARDRPLPGGEVAAAEIMCSYRAVGGALRAARGGLQEFLTERYCLYAERRGRLTRAEILHAPWELQRGEARVERMGMLGQLGLEAPREEAVLYYAERLDVVALLPRQVRVGSKGV